MRKFFAVEQPRRLGNLVPNELISNHRFCLLHKAVPTPIIVLGQSNFGCPLGSKGFLLQADQLEVGSEVGQRMSTELLNRLEAMLLHEVLCPHSMPIVSSF